MILLENIGLEREIIETTLFYKFKIFLFLHWLVGSFHHLVRMSKNILLFFVDSRGYFHIRISWLVSQKKVVLLVLSLISNI